MYEAKRCQLLMRIGILRRIVRRIACSTGDAWSASLSFIPATSSSSSGNWQMHFSILNETGLVSIVGTMLVRCQWWLYLISALYGASGWIITDHVLWCQLHLGLYKEDVTLNYSVENPELCMYSLMPLDKLPLASAKMLKVLETIFDWLVPLNLGVCIGIHLNHKSSASWSQYIPQTWSKMRSANSEGVL